MTYYIVRARSDGRTRLSINFASDGQGNLGVLAYTPPPHQKDARTGDLTRPYKGLDVDEEPEKKKVSNRSRTYK